MDAFGVTSNVVRAIRARRAGATAFCAVLLLAAVSALAPGSLADQPFAPSRDYDLTHARIELRFDLEQRKVVGQVTHTLSALREDLRQLDLDSVDLTITGVRVDGKEGRFSTDAQKLHINLETPSKARQQYEVVIRYEGKPKKGLYFILPDKSRPNQTRQIWTQGQAEDTRYYIPIYDYPNDRTTTEMIVTVPGDWETVSNGRLVSVTGAAQGMKTWTWRQGQPISTYLISLVAGEFEKESETWRNLSVDYVVPRGQRERIAPTFARTRDMLTYFSDRLGVPYPWDKYAQSSVDQFVIGGMENVSATTLTARSLLHPTLARESLQRSDGLISHELAHQWFGDLVTCKDWANLWLNEGFATFLADLWEERQYGADNAAYSRWRDQAAWMRQGRLFTVPVVTRDFNDSLRYTGNIYGKAGLILQMLREQLGDEAFFGALKHYLEKNRLGNVVTEDLVKALEESTGTNLDRFFGQWIYGAGAPRFAVSSAYDAATQRVSLTVRQTQRVGGAVGLFSVPIEIAITTAGGTQSLPIRVSRAEETFSFPADGPPLLVLFDKGSRILKSVEFRKSPAEWIYQLQQAETVVDRAAAAEALGDVKDNDAVVAALGEAALRDRFWGVRVQALLALGRIGGAEAARRVLAATSNSEPWVREAAVEQLGRFKDDASLAGRLAEISRSDAAYRVRAMALNAYAQLKPAGGLAVLQDAARAESPDDVIRRAALRAMGALGDDKAVATLLDWSAEGKPIGLRTAAISSLAQLDKKNEAIGRQFIAYLDDAAFDIRTAAVNALGDRDDPAAIPALEAMLRRTDLPVNFSNVIERQIDRLKRTNTDSDAGPAQAPPSAAATPEVVERLGRLEQSLTEVNDRLKRIEQALPARSDP